MSLVGKVTPHIYKSSLFNKLIGLLLNGTLSSSIGVVGATVSSITPGFSSNKDATSLTKILLVPTVILCRRCQDLIMSTLFFSFNRAILFLYLASARSNARLLASIVRFKSDIRIVSTEES